MLYSRKVLRQLCHLRQELDLSHRVDRFVMALVLGVMHANYRPGRAIRGLSVSMPNTFSMSPAYVRRYIEENKLRPPPADVFELLRRKASRMQLPSRDACRGRAWAADAREGEHIPESSVRLVFTSPPYLSVIKYGKYNWIRLWMLGKDPKAVDSALVATGSKARYVTFIGDVLEALLSRLRPDGYVCLMIGDVTDRATGHTTNLAQEVWEGSARPAGWRHLGTVVDRLPVDQKVTRIWGAERRGRATKTDRILILGRPDSVHQLPPLPPLHDWDTATDWTTSPATQNTA